MKLIGIRIDQKITSQSVKKNLKEEWYPFLDIYNIKSDTKPNPTNDELKEKFQAILNNNKDSIINDLYSTTDKNRPEIFVHAIAGMNGSGKSSILEIFYRLINNLAYTAIDNENREGSAPLLCARDFSATLFYEMIGTIHYLECIWNKVSTNCIVNIDGQSVEKNRLNEFFYSIAVNHSHYSLNTNEISGYIDTYIPKCYIFKKDLMSIINGDVEEHTIRHHWLNGLFHKNDGYLTPLVISPMRTEGNFNINEENKLSKQRLIGLFILYKDNFLEEYNPLNIEYTLDVNSTNIKIENYVKSWSEAKKEFNPFLRRLMVIWDNILGGLYDIEKIIESKDALSITNNLKVSHEYLILLLFQYIACKTISISTKYNNFKSVLSIEPNQIISDDDLSTLVLKIIQEPSHITLKIQQCIQYLKKVKARECYIDNEKKDVDIFYKIKETITSFIEKNGFDTKSKVAVDEVFNAMLPPIFDIDINLQPIDPKTKEKRGELVNLSGMSSGERQILYSTSAILYHLRNIHSIKGEDRVEYKHVNIILDEVEMYYHPEYQRQYTNKILTLIDNLHLDGNRIKSINICIVTHSPFILSDIPKQNILFLKNGKVANDHVKIETFGANYYDILRSSFFLTENALGSFVNIKIQDVLDLLEKEEPTNVELEQAYHIVNLIGDPFLKGYLLEKIEQYV